MDVWCGKFCRASCVILNIEIGAVSRCEKNTVGHWCHVLDELLTILSFLMEVRC